MIFDQIRTIIPKAFFMVIILKIKLKDECQTHPVLKPIANLCKTLVFDFVQNLYLGMTL